MRHTQFNTNLHVSRSDGSSILTPVTLSEEEKMTARSNEDGFEKTPEWILRRTCLSEVKTVRRPKQLSTVGCRYPTDK